MNITNNRYKVIKYILSWLPALFFMYMIFSFSAKEANVSNNQSGRIMTIVVEIVENVIDKEIAADSDIYNIIHFIVRKFGHLSEYMLLGFSLVIPYSLIFNKNSIIILTSFITSVIYAATDEIHQLFVPGRSGNLRDVCIDSVGAIIGILVFIGIKKIYNNFKAKKKV